MSLGKTILSGKINLLLTALTMASALVVVNTQHRWRSLFIAYEVAQSQTKKLELDWTQLQLDQSTLTKSDRIEKISRTQLDMEPLSSDRTQYLNTGTSAH